MKNISYKINEIIIKDETLLSYFQNLVDNYREFHGKVDNFKKECKEYDVKWNNYKTSAEDENKKLRSIDEGLQKDIEELQENAKK